MDFQVVNLIQSLNNSTKAVLKRIDGGEISGDDIYGTMLAIAAAVNESMDGTSGALYSCVEYTNGIAWSHWPFAGSSSPLSHRASLPTHLKRKQPALYGRLLSIQPFPAYTLIPVPGHPLARSLIP